MLGQQKGHASCTARRPAVDGGQYSALVTIFVSVAFIRIVFVIIITSITTTANQPVIVVRRAQEMMGDQCESLHVNALILILTLTV